MQTTSQEEGEGVRRVGRGEEKEEVLKLMNSYVKSILHRWEKVTSPVWGGDGG